MRSMSLLAAAALFGAIPIVPGPFDASPQLAIGPSEPQRPRQRSPKVKKFRHKNKMAAASRRANRK